MKYKVGDKVKIREWDDMAKEYGVGFSGDIKVPGTFVSCMNHLCGKTVEIVNINENGHYEIKGELWTISDEMIESEDKTATIEEALRLLKQGVTWLINDGQCVKMTP